MSLNQITSLVFVGFATLLTSCSSNSENDKLGTVNFDATGSDEAIKHFEEGLLLLHSFEFDDATEAFLKAQEIDSTMAMAYWGEAMTYNHPLWATQYYDEGVAALNKLGGSADERISKAQTPIEKDFMNAINILYGEGDKYDRDIKYSEFMATLYKKHPKSQEVAAFYALSLLGSVPVGRNEEVYEKGATIVKGILAENPNHPGALHYLIHSYDDPKHASAAIDAANSYMKVASAAGHALHMPSHIYVAMGMWDDVVVANELSYQASIDRMNRKKLDNDARGYHAFQWLIYGYLQQGRFEKAKEVVRDMEKFTDELPSARARVHMSLIKGAYLVDSEDWTGEFSNIKIDQKGLNISILGINSFLAGMKAYGLDDKDQLQSIIDELEKERLKVTIQIENKGIALCSGVSWESQKANQLDVDQASILEMELRSLLADMNENDAEAEDWLKKATELESNISYSYGPPPVVKPSAELYGEWLLHHDRAEEAMAQFDYSSKRAPKRVLTLKGKLKAAEILGDTEMQTTVKQELTNILHAADANQAISKI